MSTNDNNSSPPPPPPSPSSPPPPNQTPPPPEGKSSPPPPSNKNSSPSSSDKNSPSSNDNNDKSPSKSSDSGSSKNGNSYSPQPPPSRGSHGALAPPKAKSSPSSNAKNSSSNEKAIIAGVAAGAAFLLVIMIVCLVSCARRRKRKKRDEMQYYRDNPHGNKGSDYYNSGGWHNNNAQSNEYALKMPPSGQVSSEYGWRVQPPPPPPMMTSSELGSNNFSGPHQHPLPPPHPSMALGFNQSSFSYEDLAAATGGFSNTNLLGQGGFGYVHKGILPNGKEVAVKSLKANSGQGEREFQAEVEIISRVHHRHLVSLVGYCIAGSQRMLVYEFVSNGTLEYHLHGTGRPIMDWSARIKIALGSAKGFSYLHEDCHPRIIHRDIKVANILLDDNFDAQVADFGLAKLSSDTNTHVSTRIMGTFGYLAPEYASSGKLTEKSDVYSFGVVLLELITGRRPIDIHSEDEDTLVDWARPILSRAIDEHNYEEIADPRLLGNYDPQEMLAMIACAAACIRHSARRRPKMSQIVRALEGDMSIDALNEGNKTGNSATFGYSSGSEYESQSDLKRFTSNGQQGMTDEFVHSSGGESQETRKR